VAEVAEAEPLPRVLAGWPEGRRLLFCDEASGRGGADAALPVLSGHSGETDPWAILAGPEGGFTEGERARLRALPFAVPVSLGPRILRAETAAIAALVLWQAILGDWR
jgi:16S rRNA (uracil1498-N3)-methyltransferase